MEEVDAVTSSLALPALSGMSVACFRLFFFLMLLLSLGALGEADTFSLSASACSLFAFVCFGAEKMSSISSLLFCGFIGLAVAGSGVDLTSSGLCFPFDGFIDFFLPLTAVTEDG